ncbi:universal stress protein [Myxococcota bacterium]|nr:universal stress protein [Myxococcota bacterium]
MSAARPQLQRVVVAFDGSPPSLAALDVAVTLAAREHAFVTAVFVEDERWLQIAALPEARVVRSDTTTRPGTAEMTEQARALSRDVERRFRAATGRVRSELLTLRGDVATELARASEGADLVVAGRAGRSIARRLGETASHLALEVKRPVVLLRPGEALGSPIVLLEDSPGVDRVLAIARTLARRDGARAMVVAIDPSVERRAALLERAYGALARAGVQTELREAPTLDAALLMVAHKLGSTLVVASGAAIRTHADLVHLVDRSPGALVVA